MLVHWVGVTAWQQLETLLFFALCMCVYVLCACVCVYIWVPTPTSCEAWYSLLQVPQKDFASADSLEWHTGTLVLVHWVHMIALW